MRTGVRLLRFPTLTFAVRIAAARLQPAEI